LRPGSDLVFVGDVHLDRNDAVLGEFLDYLLGLAAAAGRIVLMGDLFNLWIGEPSLEQDHHRAVIATLRRIRASGTEIHYLEGNRDYRIARAHLRSTFDAVSAYGLDESWGGRRIWAAHGDLVNRRDLQYRAWRALSRSQAAWWLFSAIPTARRFAMAESLERKLRVTNVEMKRVVPEATIREYAARHQPTPGAAVVLGHFHVERDLSSSVYVLPEWKGSRRHLRATAGGELRFEDA
jgi:UDP-2,3-diacylglucosamine hydrolase